MAHVGSFKSHKKAFLNDPKCQKRGFLGLGLVDRLDISYYDKTTSLIDRIDFKLHNLIVKLGVLNLVRVFVIFCIRIIQ